MATEVKVDPNVEAQVDYGEKPGCTELSEKEIQFFFLAFVYFSLIVALTYYLSTK